MENIIMGLDPASFKNMGFCIAKDSKDLMKILKSGTIVFDVDKETKDERFIELEKKLEGLIKEYKIQTIAFERTQFGKAFVMSQIYETIGVIKLIAYKNCLTIKEISPMTAKKAITGNGRAKKKEIMQSVIDIFKINKKNLSSEHEADAIAICFAHTKIEK